MQLFQFFAICFLLSSCVPSIRTTTYFDEVTEEYIDLSQPIELTLEDYIGPRTSATLILERNRSKEKYFLKIRWNIQSKYRPEIADRDSLKFMIDEDIRYIFSPITPPRIVRINVDSRSFEEESIYEIPRELLEICLRAERIKVFVTGKKLSLKTDLSSKIQKLAFKDFLEHSSEVDLE